MPTTGRLTVAGSRNYARYNSFEIHSTDTLRQRRSVLLDVFDISHSGHWNLGQQTPEFVFAVGQSFRPQILAVIHKQEHKEARLARRRASHRIAAWFSWFGTDG
jgi:hypothetical protein